MNSKNKLTLAQKLKLREYLGTECKYGEKEISQALAAVEKMTPEMREELMDFIIRKKVASTVVEGVTVSDLMEKADMNPVTAYLAMDFLLTDPETAKYVLTRKREKLEIDEEMVEQLLIKAGE